MTNTETEKQLLVHLLKNSALLTEEQKTNVLALISEIDDSRIGKMVDVLLLKNVDFEKLITEALARIEDKKDIQALNDLKDLLKSNERASHKMQEEYERQCETEILNSPGFFDGN